MKTPKTRNLTLARYLEEIWLPSATRTVKQTTLDGYEGHLRYYLVPNLGSIALRRLKPVHLNSFYFELSQTNSYRSSKPLSPTTIKRIHSTIHRALNDAVKWGYLDVNPASNSDPPRVPYKANPLRTWSAEQAAAFLKHTRTHALAPVWVLLLTTGMRRGEVLGLRWCDVDLEKGNAAVRQALVEVKGRRIVAEPKSRNSVRAIALDEMTIRVLAEHRHKSPDRVSPESLVFSDEDGEPLDPNKVTKHFTQLTAEASLPRIRLHDLRHTHATLALQAGIHPKIVSERLGHSTVALTLDVYSHALGTMQKEAAEQIGELIFQSEAERPSRSRSDREESL